MNRIMYIGEHPKTYDVRMHKHKHWEAGVLHRRRRRLPL